MTFDIKTINKENIVEELNYYLNIINMIIELQKKYDKEDEDKENVVV